MVLCRSVIPSAIMAVALVTVAGIVRAADDLPKAGKQVITVTGKIKVTNHGDAARFDRRMLSALQQHRLETYADSAASLQVFGRSAARRLGQACVGPCRSRWGQYN